MYVSAVILAAAGLFKEIAAFLYFKNYACHLFVKVDFMKGMQPVFMQTLIVTAAIIQHNKHILIAQRKENVDQPLKWEFPGGKLEPGESPEQCLAREIQEELGLSIEVMKIYYVISHNYSDRQIILLCYLCRLIAGTAQALDCRDFKWVLAGELHLYDFAEADKPVVSNLQADIFKHRLVQEYIKEDN